jgi:hypothetical protein
MNLANLSYYKFNLIKAKPGVKTTSPAQAKKG